MCKVCVLCLLFLQYNTYRLKFHCIFQAIDNCLVLWPQLCYLGRNVGHTQCIQAELLWTVRTIHSALYTVQQALLHPQLNESLTLFELMVHKTLFMTLSE